MAARRASVNPIRRPDTELRPTAPPAQAI